MGVGRSYGRYVRQVRQRFEIQRDLEAAHKSTAELLREEREAREEAVASAAGPREDVRPEGPKPHKRAQWDEKRGAWVVWVDARGDWVPYGEPGTLA